MLFTNLGKFTVRRRRSILSLTVLFIVIAGVLGAGAFGTLQSGGFEDPGAESTRAHALLESQFDTGDPNVVVLVRAATGTVDSTAVVDSAQSLTTELASAAGVSHVVSYWSLGNAPPLRSTDGKAALILARIDGPDSRFSDLADSLHARHDSAVTIEIGGARAVGADLGALIGSDLAKSESISVPITLALLVVVFGGLIAAGLPLLIALVSVAGTFLSLFVIGSITDVSIYSINLTTALGLGLAVDYSLFVVTRYREELAKGLDPNAAVVRTVETAGRTVAFSACIVAASLLALLVLPLFFLRSFAYAGISVVLIAAAGAVVVLPAFLAVLGTRVNRFSIRRHGHAVGQVGSGEGFWHRLASGVMRRPIPVAIGAVGVLVFLGAPFLKVNFGLPTANSLPRSAESRQVADAIATTFVSKSSEQFAVVAPTLPTADESAIGAYAATVSALANVASVTTATGTYVDGKLSAAASDSNVQYGSGMTGVYFSVTPSVSQQTDAGEALVRTIRLLDQPFATGVEGPAAQLIDTKAAIESHLPYALGIIAVVTFVLLFLVFGSVLVPIKAIILNLLSLTATFGAMVWVFQQGHGSAIFGFTPDGTLDTSMPILMFCIAFGLSMDYEVFLLSRIKEEYDRSGDNTHAVATGLERTGRIVTAAAALLAVTFAAFGLSGVTFIKMFGVGLALAVVMDATLIRGLLVPAFMRLAGDANWWAPAWMKALHRSFGIHEGEPREDSSASLGDGSLVAVLSQHERRLTSEARPTPDEQDDSVRA